MAGGGFKPPKAKPTVLQTVTVQDRGVSLSWDDAVTRMLLPRDYPTDIPYLAEKRPIPNPPLN